MRLKTERIDSSLEFAAGDSTAAQGDLSGASGEGAGSDEPAVCMASTVGYVVLGVHGALDLSFDGLGGRDGPRAGLLTMRGDGRGSVFKTRDSARRALARTNAFRVARDFEPLEASVVRLVGVPRA